MRKTFVNKILASIIALSFMFSVAAPAFAQAPGAQQASRIAADQADRKDSADVSGGQPEASSVESPGDAQAAEIGSGDVDIELAGGEKSGSASSGGGIKGLIKGAIEKIKPHDGLTAGERAGNMLERIKKGEPVLERTGKNAIDFNSMSSGQAAIKAGTMSLKSSFSPLNLGLSAATTFGGKVIGQLVKGEKVDIKAAAKEVVSGKNIGSIVGSGLGGALGNAANVLLSTSVPVVGPIIGAFLPSLFSMTGGALGGQFGDDVSKGNMPSFKRAWASIDKADLAGRVVGTTIGAAIGSLICPGIGTAIGSFVGGFVGSKVAGLIKGLFNKGKEKPPMTNKVENIRFGVEPNVLIWNVVPTSNEVYLVEGDKYVKISDKVVEIREKMTNAYKRYVQYLSAGKADSNEGRQSLVDFRKYSAELESLMASVKKAVKSWRSDNSSQN